MKKARIRKTEAGLQKGLCLLETHHLPYRFKRSATTRTCWKGCVSFCAKIIAMGNELQIWLYFKNAAVLALFPFCGSLFNLVRRGTGLTDVRRVQRPTLHINRVAVAGGFHPRRCRQ
jgi:hypothetical protein